MEKLIKLLENGWEVHLYSVIKRVTTKDDNIREWVLRYCWEAEKGEEKRENAWGGFETPKEAIMNLLSNLQ